VKIHKLIRNFPTRLADFSFRTFIDVCGVGYFRVIAFLPSEVSCPAVPFLMALFAIVLRKDKHTYMPVRRKGWSGRHHVD